MDMFDYRKDYGKILSREEIEKLQLRRLKEVIRYAQEKSEFYKKLFKKSGIRLSHIKTLSDIKNVPIVTKDELCNQNQDFIAISPSRWADVFVTSGTGGRPVYVPHSKRDLESMAMLSAKLMKLAGFRKGDIVYLTLPMGNLWLPGIMFWLAGLDLGCCVIRAGGLSLEEHMEKLLKFKPSVLIGLPSYLIKLGRAFRETGKLDWNIKLIFVIVENIYSFELENNCFKKNKLALELLRVWRANDIRELYATVETGDIFHDCEGGGYHLFPECAYAEIVDPKTYQPLPRGEKGLLVFTNFYVKEAMPLIRYASGDIGFSVPSLCVCKRNSFRIGPILGRVDSLIKIKGVFIYLHIIEEVLMNIPEIEDYYIEINRDNLELNQIKIYFAEKGRLGAGGRLVEKVQTEIKKKAGVNLKVFNRNKKEIKETIERYSSIRKTRRIIDLRENK